MTEETIKALVGLREALLRRRHLLSRMIEESGEAGVVVGMWVGCNDALELVYEALRGE